MREPRRGMGASAAGVGSSMPAHQEQYLGNWRNNYPRALRVERREKKRVMRKRGIKPARKLWITCVVVTAIEIPKWASYYSHRAFSRSKQHVWFKGRPRTHAKRLIAEDRAAGGEPEVTTVEYRRCPVCKRPMLGLEAEVRRRIDESWIQGRDVPCSGECKS